jgi:hypothetical protein
MTSDDDSRPLLVLECLKAMFPVEADEQWRVMRCRRGIAAVLTSTLSNPDAAVAQDARELCNRLVARGHREFIALLSPKPS